MLRAEGVIQQERWSPERYTDMKRKFNQVNYTWKRFNKLYLALEKSWLCSWGTIEETKLQMLLTFDVQPSDVQNEDDDNHSKNTDRGF